MATDCDERNALEERLRKLEDVQAITNLIAAYGPAADTCNVEEVRPIWHAAGTCEIAGAFSWGRRDWRKPIPKPSTPA